MEQKTYARDRENVCTCTMGWEWELEQLLQDGKKGRLGLQVSFIGCACVAETVLFLGVPAAAGTCSAIAGGLVFHHLRSVRNLVAKCNEWFLQY